MKIIVFFLGTHLSNQPKNNETLRRGMSIALNHSERPTPPVRRTPSMNTNIQHINNSDVTIRLKCPQETFRSTTEDDDFPPPPEFLLSNDSKTETLPLTTTHSSLLAEIRRGNFKLRKTVTDRDRSAPRLK